MSEIPRFDVAVIGGGPAGAHAAWKAALLYRTAVMFDKGRKFSRIFWSPRVDNLPGRYGEAGRLVVAKGYEDIATYEEDIGRKLVTIHENTKVTTVERTDDGFHIKATGKGGDKEAIAKVLILATGAIDGQPKLADFRRRDIEAVLPYANKGLADYCLLCDGHTVEGKRVAVLGCGPGAASIASSLKENFGAETVVVAACSLGHPEGMDQSDDAWEKIAKRLAAKEIPVLTAGVKEFTGIKDGKFSIIFEGGSVEEFDKAWITMGWHKVNNEQASQIGAQLDDYGFVVTDKDGRIQAANGGSIPGAYAIGDLRSDSWKQIPIAWGEAEAAVIDAFVSNKRADVLN
jgi:thioredoxin reductase